MLSSTEVGTLVTALGCGIGSEEFDLAKLRYHWIIIMTDADVDGSHIRTLLMTFFYRWMPSLIERGYLYIAQPPLYKVKRGKQERYVKDDAELDSYLMELALDGARVELPDDALLQGESLHSVSRDYLTLRGITKRLSRRVFPEVLEAMMHLPLLDGGRVRIEFITEPVVRTAGGKPERRSLTHRQLQRRTGRPPGRRFQGASSGRDTRRRIGAGGRQRVLPLCGVPEPGEVERASSWRSRSGCRGPRRSLP